MDKLNGSLNKIDKIIDTIEKNDYLKKTNQGENLKRIIELNKKNKNNLSSKLATIKRFSEKLQNIISNKPEPESIDKKLVEYIGYDDYYSKNKK